MALLNTGHTCTYINELLPGSLHLTILYTKPNNLFCIHTKCLLSTVECYLNIRNGLISS